MKKYVMTSDEKIKKAREVAGAMRCFPMLTIRK